VNLYFCTQLILLILDQQVDLFFLCFFCYRAVSFISKNHSKGGKKLSVECETTDTENEAPQVAPCIPHDNQQVEFLFEFKLKLVDILHTFKVFVLFFAKHVREF
jgi:hypothetical protein